MYDVFFLQINNVWIWITVNKCKKPRFWDKTTAHDLLFGTFSQDAYWRRNAGENVEKGEQQKIRDDDGCVIKSGLNFYEKLMCSIICKYGRINLHLIEFNKKLSRQETCLCFRIASEKNCFFFIVFIHNFIKMLIKMWIFSYFSAWNKFFRFLCCQIGFTLRLHKQFHLALLVFCTFFWNKGP